MILPYPEIVYVKISTGIVAISILLHKICNTRCPNLLNILWLVVLIEFMFCVWLSFGLFLLYVVNHGL